MTKTRITNTIICSISALWLSGCSAHNIGTGRMDNQQHSSHQHGDTAMVKHYHRQLNDPHWMVRAGEFHGHLGPWVTVGAMIGEHALQQLKTTGQWDVEVICWMPPDRQRQPFSCIIDGLQTSTGATMGKCNIRLAYSPEVVPDNQTVVYVIRRQKGDHSPAGLIYRLTPSLADMLSHITPDKLEETSRKIAKHNIKELFEISPMTDKDLTTLTKPSS